MTCCLHCVASTSQCDWVLTMLLQSTSQPLSPFFRSKGSGEFHVYKQARRREYERLKQMELEEEKVSRGNEEEDNLKRFDYNMQQVKLTDHFVRSTNRQEKAEAEFRAKQEARKAEDEARIARNRAKRLKKKEKGKKRKGGKSAGGTDGSATGPGGSTSKKNDNGTGADSSSDDSDSDGEGGSSKKRKLAQGAGASIVFKTAEEREEEEDDEEPREQEIKVRRTEEAISNQPNDQNQAPSGDGPASVAPANGITIVDED